MLRDTGSFLRVLCFGDQISYFVSQILSFSFEFRVMGSGLRATVLGFSDYGLGLRVKVQDLGLV